MEFNLKRFEEHQIDEKIIEELIKALEFKGYMIRKAKWKNARQCYYCRTRIVEGFNVAIKINYDDEWIFETCSKSHAIKLIVSTLSKEFARRLTDIYADPKYASFLKLLKTLSKRGYEYVSYDEPFRVHAFPENNKPEVLIFNNYPTDLGIWIDYIELKHRDFIISLLDEIAINFSDANKELILDTRHTPYYEVNDVVRMVLELYCMYMQRGFKPSVPVRCSDE